MQRTCPKCGGVTKGNSTICIKCGASLNYVLPDMGDEGITTLSPDFSVKPVFVETTLTSTSVKSRGSYDSSSVEPKIVVAFVLALVSLFWGFVFAIVALIVGKGVVVKTPEGLKCKGYGLLVASKVVSWLVIGFWVLLFGLIALPAFN